MTVDPIKSKADIERIKALFLYRKQYRNYLMFNIGINSFLRIGDLVRLKFKDVYDFKNRFILDELSFTDGKTKQRFRVIINYKMKEALVLFIQNMDKSDLTPNSLIFNNGREGNQAISEKTGWQIVKKACDELGIKGNFGSHTMRKTKARHYYDDAKDKSKALIELMIALKHSSSQVTLRYIGIEKEEIDKVYLYAL